MLRTAICPFWEEELPDGCLGLEPRVPRSRRLEGAIRVHYVDHGLSHGSRKVAGIVRPSIDPSLVS